MKKLLLATIIAATSNVAMASTPVTFEKDITAVCGLTLNSSKGELAFTDTVSGVSPLEVKPVNNDSTKEPYLTVTNIQQSGLPSSAKSYFYLSSSSVDAANLAISQWKGNHDVLIAGGINWAGIPQSDNYPAYFLSAGVDAALTTMTSGKKSVNATLVMVCK